MKGWIWMKELNEVEKKIAERNNTPEKQAEKDRKAAEALAKKIAGKEKQDKPKAKPAPKKDKQKAKAEPKQDKQVAKPQDAAILTTKEVAAMVGTTPKALRRVLRAKWYNDGKMTHYTWTKNDPILKEILDHYKKAEAGK